MDNNYSKLSLGRIIKLSVLTIFLFQISSAFGLKVTVFKTLSDFQEKNGQEVGELESFNRIESPAGNTFSLNLVGKKDKVKMNDVWGFTVDEFEFRMWKNLPYVIMSKGEFYYYERGDLKLHELLGTRMIVETGEVLRFYSKEIEGDVFSHRKIFKYQKKVYPGLRKYVDCIYEDKKKAANPKFKLEVTRNCFKNINGN